MKILIIGSKGMLGKELAKAFSQNHQVIGWDKEEIDITNEERLREKIIELKPDMIINSAAYNNVDACEENFELAKTINGLAAGYLGKIANQLDIPLIHFSTGYVFDGEDGNYMENDFPHPISKYAESKLMGEQELQRTADKFYLIRTNLLFGQPGDGQAKKSFVELMLSLAKDKKKLQGVDDERSNPTYVKDLAEATYKLVTAKFPYGIYHLVNNGDASWYEWAKEIFREKGINIEIEAVKSDKFPRAARRPKNSSLLNTKFPKLRSWQEALGEFLREVPPTS